MSDKKHGRDALRPWQVLAYLLYNPDVDRHGNACIVPYADLIKLTRSHHLYIKDYLSKLLDAGVIISLTFRKHYAIIIPRPPVGMAVVNEHVNERLQADETPDDSEVTLPPGDESA